MLVEQAVPLTTEIDKLGPGPWVITVPGIMRGKGRPRFSTQGGRARAYTDSKTASLEAVVRQCAFDQVGQINLLGPLAVQISVVLPIAKSWSKGERQAAERGGLLPTGKPDLDNIVKLIFDALNGMVWRDDSQICQESAAKSYGTTPMTVVRVEAL